MMASRMVLTSGSSTRSRLPVHDALPFFQSPSPGHKAMHQHSSMHEARHQLTRTQRTSSNAAQDQRSDVDRAQCYASGIEVAARLGTPREQPQQLQRWIHDEWQCDEQHDVPCYDMVCCWRVVGRPDAVWGRSVREVRDMRVGVKETAHRNGMAMTMRRQKIRSGSKLKKML